MARINIIWVRVTVLYCMYTIQLIVEFWAPQGVPPISVNNTDSLFTFFLKGDHPSSIQKWRFCVCPTRALRNTPNLRIIEERGFNTGTSRACVLSVVEICVVPLRCAFHNQIIHVWQTVVFAGFYSQKRCSALCWTLCYDLGFSRHQPWATC